MTKPAEHRFADEGSAAVALARSIAIRMQEAVAARGRATIALSGGRSPRAMLEALGQEPLDWDRIIVTLVDERWVEPDHPDSNGRLVRDALLQGGAAAATFVPMKNDAPDPYAGQPACEQAIAAVPRPFDVVLLGMGEDGHTASLFPGAAKLGAGLTTHALTLAVTPPAAPYQRMSLSLSAILQSRVILLQIAGPAKEAIYRHALADGPVVDMPVRAVLKQSATPVETWLSA